MEPKSAPHFAATLLLLLFAGAPAGRAAFVPWTYSWTRGTMILPAGTGGIAFTRQHLQHANGSAEVTATTLVMFSSATDSKPDRLGKSPYHLTMTVTDGASHQSGSLTFGGVLNGTFSWDRSHLASTFLSPKAQAVHLGHYWYFVSLSGVVAPTPTSAGHINASVTVKHNPEPSTLVLAGVGLGFVGLLCRRRARELGSELHRIEPPAVP
jgi:hypothetical protein